MKLAQLINREDFSSIFVKTIEKFLIHNYGWNGSVKWIHRNKSKSDNSFFINERLNLIYHKEFDTLTLRKLSKEYSYHTTFIKKIIHKTYIRLSFEKFLRNFTSKYIVEIDPLPENFKKVVILGGNHTIRLIDYNNYESIVLGKCGFKNNYIQSLVSVRTQYKNIPGPALINHSIEGQWYIEDIISGLPLNRIDKFSKEYKVTLNEAREFMIGLYLASEKRVSLDAWLSDRYEKITYGLKNLPSCYSDIIKKEITTSVSKLLRNNLFKNIYISIAQTHGDFQNANILSPIDSDSSHAYIIDWEYTDVRPIFYDALVYELDSRFPEGLAKRFQAFLTNNEDLYKSINWCTGHSNAIKNNSVNDILTTFLIEDLFFRIQDTSIYSLKKPNDGFVKFLEEFNIIVNRLK